MVTDVEKADKALTNMENRSRKAIKILLSGLVTIVIALSGSVVYLIGHNYGETARINNAVISKTDQLCSFFGIIASIPPDPRSSKVGIEFLVNSRAAYAGLGCSPVLPGPSDALKIAANKYHIQIKE